MLVICPRCSRKYMVEDRVFNPLASMRLKCAVCEHEWDHYALNSLPEEKTQDQQAHKDQSMHTPAAKSPEEPKMEENPQRMDPFSNFLGWAMFFTAVIGLALIGIFCEDKLCQAWPPITKFYQTFENSPNSPFVIQGVKTQIAQKGDSRTALITGVLKNTAAKPHSIPPIRVYFKQSDETQEEGLDPFVFHPLEGGTLRADEEILFQSPAIVLPQGIEALIISL